MAKKFVKVNGLHNLLASSGNVLLASTLKSDVTAANSNSICFITCNETDTGYSIDNGSNIISPLSVGDTFIWTHGKIYDTNNTRVSGDAIKPFELDIEEVDDVEYFDNGDDEGKFVVNNDSYYKVTKESTLEFDLTQLVPSNDTKRSVDKLINQQGSLAWAFNFDSGSICSVNNGLIADLGDDNSFVFSLEGTEQYPHMYIDSIDVTCERVNKTGETTTFQIDGDDYQDENSGWVRRAVSDNEISFTLNRHNLQTEVEDPEDPSKTIVVTVDANPLDYISFSLYRSSESGDNLIRFKRLVFHVCSVDSENDYSDGNYHDLYYFKSSSEEELLNSVIPDEEHSKSLYRLNNKLIVTDESKTVIPQYKKIHSVEEITDGDYLIGGNGSFIMSSYDSDEYTIDGETEIYREGDVIPINDDQDEDYLHMLSFNIHYDGTNIHVKSNGSNQYIGYTGSKNGIETNLSDVFTNTVSIVDENIIITCEGSGPSTLQHNSGGHLFRFYKSAQNPISLYKKIGLNPYSWNKVIRKTDLHRIATSGDYNDLSNKPSIPDVGDVIIKDFDVLPKASLDYAYIIGRCNHKLYDINNGEGWNFSPIEFCRRYPNISGSSATNQLRDWMIEGLNLTSGLVSVDYFSESSRLSTTNTSDRGIQIGSSSNEGMLKMRLTKRTLTTDEEIVGGNFEFSKVSLTFEQYDNETTHTIISIGNSYKRAYVDEESGEEMYEDVYNEVASGNVDFEYEEDSEILKKSTITLDTSEIENCNTIMIYTELQGERDRGRIVLLDFAFDNLQYLSQPDDEPTVFTSNLRWVTMSGDSLIAGPGIEIDKGIIKNTLFDNVITKRDGTAISEAMYKIKEAVGLDENLNLDDEPDSILTRVNDTEQCVVTSIHKVKEKTGLTRTLDLPDDFDYASLVTAINDLKTRIENLESR